MGRQERRQEERKKRADAWAEVSPKNRPWVSRAVNGTLTLHDLEVAEFQAYKRGFASGCDDSVTTCYASAALVLSEDFGFDQDKLVDFLCKLDDAVRFNIDSEEKRQEAFDKTGIKISFGEPLQRIEKKE